MANKSFRCILLGTILGAAALANAQAVVRSVEATPVSGGVEIKIQGDGLKKPKELSAWAGKSYILEFDAKVVGGGKRFTVNQSGLSYVQYGWYSPRPPKVRVHLRFQQAQKPSLTQTDGGWVVLVGNATASHEAKQPNHDESAMKSAMALLNAKSRPSPPKNDLQKAMDTSTAPPPIKPSVGTIPPPLPDDQAMRDAEALLSSHQAVQSQPAPVVKGAVESNSPATAAPAKQDQNDLQKAIAALDEEQRQKAKKPAVAKPASDSFPETVPPLEPAPTSPTMQRNPSGGQMVSLDFVNTDIVQILKALALQTNVNIVTAPEVKGSLTVSLTNVPLKEALDLVTTMAGVRYAQVGRTYVVTTAAKFSEAIRQVTGATKTEWVSETRVVPIFSGEGAQIKAAVLKSLPLETPNGRFEIVLPSEELTVESKQTVQAESDKSATADGKTAGGEQDKGATIETKAANTQKAKDQYVVLIGPKTRLDEVEHLVKALDSQISSAMGIDYPASSMIVRDQYLVRGGNAADLLEALGAKNGKLGNVDVAATPKTSTSRQSIVLVGREHEVLGVLKTLADLDSEDAVLTKMVAYDVKFADPRALREDLVGQVPGLRVIIPPASAGNPRVFQPGKGVQQATEATQASTTSVPGATAAGGGAPESQKVGGDLEKPGKLSQPFTDFETSAVPMKLILRGSDDQIERGMSYLAVVDTAPKQVALELRVVELSKNDAIKAGIDWNILGGGAVKILRLNNSHPDGGNNAIGANFSGSGFSGDVGATLDRILDANKIIARPNMLAIDGRESELFVGDTVRYIKSIQSTQNGVTVTTDEVKVGVRLNVLPRIGAGGNLTMDIRPVVSFLRGFTDVPGGGKLPQTSDRVAQSTVNIMSGETIAIGGLIQDQDTKSESGLPILMDLPIVGHLFKRSTNQKIRTEVVIFLTARALDGPANSNYQLPMQIKPTPELKKGKGGKEGN